jgi:ABC-type multidrug transport system ATPase subunit
MLELSSVKASYGPIKALNGISLAVKKGEIVTLLGANGAGKSTTLMTISGVNTAVNGEIRYKGERIDGLPAHEIVFKGLCQVPEGRRIFSRLSVRENLDMGAFTLKDKAAIAKNLDEVFELSRPKERKPAWRHAQARTADKGHRARLCPTPNSSMTTPWPCADNRHEDIQNHKDINERGSPSCLGAEPKAALRLASCICA